VSGADVAELAGAQRIAAAFADTGGKRAALMPYLMGGFPDLAGSREIGLAYAAAGADVIELGVPFSDPLADGAVIHAAGTRALAAGATLSGVLEVAADLAQAAPVVVMCYANVVLARGPQPFAATLADAGVSGLIVPDLPLEEAPLVLGACDLAGVALVPLVAPTTPDERMTAIATHARGFLYTVSVLGTTGERNSLAASFAEIVSRAHSHTTLPVAVGFGISSPQLALEAAQAGADGVIVGTRLVRAVAEAGERPAAAAGELVSEFASALRAG
jgi:tryptophan synthase alpha chain